MNVLAKLWTAATVPYDQEEPSSENTLPTVADIDAALQVYGWGEGATSRMEAARRLHFRLWRIEREGES